MEPIYDRNGRVVSWLEEKNIYHLNGLHAGLISGINVYGHNGQHLGIFKNGLYRDHMGGTVAFIRGASGGPVLPVPLVPPRPPMLLVPPIPALPSIPPDPVVPSLDWGITWDQFINA